MKIKLSDYISQFIVNLGVKHVFMVPGGGAMHLNDSIGYQKGIEFICNQHEQASAFAAETYAKTSDNIGVAIVTTGPGGTNAITGAVGAWFDSTPCLFISGQAKRSDLIGNLGIRQHGVQEVDIITLVKSITKYAITIMEPYSIRFHLEKAVYLAKSGRPGPVWIDVPLDVQAATIDTDFLEEFNFKSDVDEPSEKNDLFLLVSKTIKLLNKSERPILLLGNGIRLSGARNKIEELIDKLKLPFLLTWPAIDFFSDNHELLVGRPGPVAPRGANFALQNSDYLLTIGARLDIVVTGYAPDKFARAAKKIMVDIDQAEIRKMGTNIDLAICADAKAFIMEFLNQINTVLPKKRLNWISKCKNWKIKYPIILPEYRLEKLVSTYILTDVLSEELTTNDIIVSGSSGAGIEIFLLAFRAKKGQRVVSTEALGAMGTGLPASIGACLASRKKRTICVNGDGGLQFNIQEFETLARLKLPIKLFVLNNNGYSSIRTSQSRYFGRLTGADTTSGLSLPDICKVADAYGLTVLRITDQTNLVEKVRNVLNRPGLVVCEVLTPADEPRAPCMMSMQKPDGSMVSKPLEDLWPFLDRDEFLSNMIIPPIEE